MVRNTDAMNDQEQDAYCTKCEKNIITKKQKRLSRDYPIWRSLCKVKFSKLAKQLTANLRFQMKKRAAARAAAEELLTDMPSTVSSSDAAPRLDVIALTDPYTDVADDTDECPNID